MKKYAETVANIIREMDNSIETEIKEACKANDEMLIGIIIGMNGTDEKPIIYVNSFAENGISERKCAEIMIDTAKVERGSLKEIAENDFSWDSVKDKIAIKLLNTDLNREFLKDLVHEDFENGLSIAFDIAFGDEFRVNVKNSLAETIGCDYMKLLSAAQHNEANKPFLMKLDEMTVNGDRTNIIDSDIDERDGMFVLTTENGWYGASAICMAGTGDKIKSIIGDFYLLPSSVHEWIVIPESAGIPVEALKAMVCEANKTVVRNEDILSDNVYKWVDIFTGFIAVA